jgi:HAD superfamily hydrolase (TIGR01509 family)
MSSRIQMQPIKAVVFDLDGTLLSTETLVVDVARRVLESYGKELTQEALVASIGKTPLEAWQSTMEVVGLAEQSCTAAKLYEESEAILEDLWQEATYLPGSVRLLRHLSGMRDIKLGLATSTPRKVLAKKTLNKPLLNECFDAVVCGDDEDLLGKGKPHPDCFLKVASLLGVEPGECVVVEDAPSGLLAATNAGCMCVYVPSIPQDTTMLSDHRVCRLSTLLEFFPESFGLAPFSDSIEGTIPLISIGGVDQAIRLQGTVVKGFGRGSAQLGIPTANVDGVSVSSVIPGSTTGIFYGFAALGAFPRRVYPMCCSIGFNPFFKNIEKTCEPWILHDFDGADFKGTTIKLVIVGFIRGESNFSSLEELIERIRLDAEVTKKALKDERLAVYGKDAFFLTS